jgi:hypothetical protein
MGLLGFCAADGAADGEGLSGSLGAGYQHPAPGSIADRYAGGAAFHAGIEARVGPGLIAIEAGYHRSSASLDAPYFLEGAEGTLAAVPIDLIARFPLMGPRPVSPYAGAGFELLWIRESFRYRFDGSVRESRGEGAVRPGGILVAGVDRTRFPRVRLEGFLSYVPIHRMRSSLDSTYQDGAAPRSNAGVYGARLTWMLP